MKISDGDLRPFRSWQRILAFCLASLESTSDGSSNFNMVAASRGEPGGIVGGHGGKGMRMRMVPPPDRDQYRSISNHDVSGPPKEAEFYSATTYVLVQLQGFQLIKQKYTTSYGAASSKLQQAPSDFHRLKDNSNTSASVSRLVFTKTWYPWSVSKWRERFRTMRTSP